MRLTAAILYRLLRAMTAVRKPSFVIGEAHRPYMRRWYVIPRNKRFNIYLHQILRDDDDRALHDHPWKSWSLMLHGRLGEVYADTQGVHRMRTFKPGDVVKRGANFAHRLFLPRIVIPLWGGGNAVHEAEAWTLFVTGSVVRDWGFHCPKGWVHHTDFTSPLHGGQIGRGCE